MEPPAGTAGGKGEEGGVNCGLTTGSVRLLRGCAGAGIKKRNIEPTKLLPLWDIRGVTLGVGTAMLGEKAAMLCTASVEEVIDGHYKDQTYKLGKDEKKLKEKIMKFRQDELEHKDIAYDNGATKKGLFGVLDKIIKTSSRIAITISEKI